MRRQRAEALRQPATWLAIAALVFAMGAPAWAARALIGTRNLRDGAVTRPKLADGAVSARKLAPSVRSELARAGSPGPAGTP
jgi:hypothetical protein